MSQQTDSRRSFDAFISHAEVDSVWALLIARHLRKAGASVWLDAEQVRPGDDLVEAISDGLRRSRFLIAVVSHASAQSRWVRAEVAAAAKDPATAVIEVLVDSETESLLPSSLTVELPSANVASGLSTLAQIVARDAPTLSPSPEWFRPPPPVSATFVNRKKEVERLRLYLLERAEIRPVIIIGPRGVGKTALASAFVSAHGSRFARVFWVSGASLSMITRADIEWIADSVTSSTPDARALVVFDDVPNPEILESLDPADGRIAVLATTRQHAWAPTAYTLNLTPLTVAESIELLSAVLAQGGSSLEAITASSDADSAAGIAELAHGNPAMIRALGNALLTQSAASLNAEAAAIRHFAESAALESSASEGAPSSGYYYLDSTDPSSISRFDAAFLELLNSTGNEFELSPPIEGSWLRRFTQRYPDERIDAALDKAERALEVAALTRPEGAANRDHAEATARLLEASSQIPNLVVSSGSVLFIKVTDDAGPRVFSKTLSATEMKSLEANPGVLGDPMAALDHLGLIAGNEERSVNALGDDGPAPLGA